VSEEITTAEVLGLPLDEQERYVTRRELAEIMGISVRAVDRLRAQGMPCESWGLRAVRFQPSRAIAWARAQAGERRAA
jgi:phage terminase Nu1 subunit (DNA packaging protein)